MPIFPITHLDQELIESARRIIEKNYLPGKHRVGAAVRTKQGVIFTGIHLNSTGVDICAEAVALGNAMTNGHRDIDCIVSVLMRDQEDWRVISPCGNCRELIHFYGNTIQVIFPLSNTITKCSVDYLLPSPYFHPLKRPGVNT